MSEPNDAAEVLAEALHDIDPDADGNLSGDPLEYFGRWADRLIAALAARGYVLQPAGSVEYKRGWADGAADEALAVLLPAILSNGIPHAGHNQLCHEADAKVVRAAWDATAGVRRFEGVHIEPEWEEPSRE